MAMNDGESEDLPLIFQMVSLDKKDRNNHHRLHGSGLDLNHPLPGQASLPGTSLKILPSDPKADDILSSEFDGKNDYDWLMTPPGTPILEDKSNKKSSVGHVSTPKASPAMLKSSSAHFSDSSSKSSIACTQTTFSITNSYDRGSYGQLSSGSGNSASRLVTPTEHVPLPSKPSRSSGSTSRAKISSKPLNPSLRSSTCAARSSTRTTTGPSKLASRPSISATIRTAPRCSAQTGRLSGPYNVLGNADTNGYSSSFTGSGPQTSKNSVSPHAASSTIRSKPLRPSNMSGFSHNPILRASLPDKLPSASLRRPEAPSSSSSSVESKTHARLTQQLCPTCRGRTSNGNGCSANSVRTVRRSCIDDDDDVNPVLIGNKMVERVVNIRRLAPPKQEEESCRDSSLTGKPLSSADGTGFGRTLSKKSLDMALRHMDIRRSMPSILRT